MNLVRKSVIFLTIITCQSVGCHQPDVMQEQAERLAGMECRAIELREQRFTLANTIRFTQDTLLHLKASDDSTGLNKKLLTYSDKKDKILQASLQLADSIHTMLDSMQKYTFRNVDDKRLFDQKLKEIMKKRGCDS